MMGAKPGGAWYRTNWREESERGEGRERGEGEEGLGREEG